MKYLYIIGKERNICNGILQWNELWITCELSDTSSSTAAGNASTGSEQCTWQYWNRMKRAVTWVTIVCFIVVVMINIVYRDNTSLTSLVSFYAIGLIFALTIANVIVDRLDRKDGIIDIKDTPEKTTWTFELSVDPEIIRKKKSATFKVRDASK